MVKIPAGLAEASIADMVMVSVKAGSPDIKKQIHPAIIIRQKKEIRRADGSRIKFADNAAVVVTEDGAMKGTEIRGPVAGRSADRSGLGCNLEDHPHRGPKLGTA